MPAVILYVLTLIATILTSSAGFTALAVIFAIITVCVLFRHELGQLRLPAIDYWRTDP